MIPLLAFSARLASSFVAETLRAAILLIVVALLLKLLPPVRAAIRSVIWTGVLLVVTFMPFLPASAARPAGNLALAAHTVHFAPVWSLLIASIWLLASLCRASGLVAGALRLRRIWRAATPVQPTQLRLVQTSGGRFRSASLCLSADVSRPSVIGFLAPRILIPTALYAKLSASELDHIVLHEMEHLRRRDDWRNLGQKLALVLFPLNPALLWLDRRLAVERELACDESVLEATHAPKSYASCLVHLAEESVLGRHLSLALGAWERRSELACRIYGILGYRFGKEGTRPHSKTYSAALVAATVLLGGALARTPTFVTFAAPLPSMQALTAYPVPSTSAFRTAALQPSVATRPHMVEAIAHMPSSARGSGLRQTSQKKPVPAPTLRRVPMRPLAPKTFVLTSWVVSVDPSDANSSPDRHFTQRHFIDGHFTDRNLTFVVFEPSLSPTFPLSFLPTTNPQVFASGVLQATRGILVIQL